MQTISSDSGGVSGDTRQKPYRCSHFVYVCVFCAFDAYHGEPAYGRFGTYAVHSPSNVHSCSCTCKVRKAGRLELHLSPKLCASDCVYSPLNYG
jgi:hypothetical protein